jgi:pimeloyl-ACP methyl ester carboxylesterase
MTVLIWIVGITVALIVLVLGGLAVFAAMTARQVEKALPPPGRFIDIDGAKIHYIDAGSGPPLVLIHGLSGQHRNFTHSLLERLKGDYRVIIPDRPGSGYSTRPRGASGALAEQARTISRLIDTLGLKRPLIVGHSLGGAIALTLAANHPDQTAGLALLAPVTHQPGRVPPLFRALVIRSPLVRSLLAWTLVIPLSMLNRDFVLDAAFGPQPPPRDYGTKGGGLLTLRPISFIGASHDLIAFTDEDDPTGRYGDIKVAVGVLYGTADRILDPTAHQTALTAKLPDAECELIEGAGHMIPITSADRCVQFIARMAQRAGVGGASRPAKGPPSA